MTTTGKLAGDGPARPMDDEARLFDERRLVEIFARDGAAKMAKRRHHGRWHDTDVDALVENLADELDELRTEMAFVESAEAEGHPDDVAFCKQRARAEAIDVAISALIVADRLDHDGCGCGS